MEGLFVGWSSPCVLWPPVYTAVFQLLLLRVHGEASIDCLLRGTYDLCDVSDHHITLTVTYPHTSFKCTANHIRYLASVFSHTPPEGKVMSVTAQLHTMLYGEILYVLMRIGMNCADTSLVSRQR